MQMSTCVLAPNKPQSNGYVMLTVGGVGRLGRGRKGAGRRESAHRWAWEQAHGPIPDGLFVLHHCDNRACINVDHLYLGTHADNMRDVRERGRAAKPRRTHCVNGHPFSPENTYHRPNGSQGCLICRRAADARSNRKRRLSHGS